MEVLQKLDKMSKSPKEREKYLMREKYIRDIATLKEEGRMEGIREGEIKTAKNMLFKSFDYNTISEITGLSIEEIEKLNQNI